MHMYFINRKLLTVIARLVLAALLFMQYSLATQACMLSEVHPAMAFATDVMPTCDMHNHPMAQHNPNACLVHCTSADQTLNSYHAVLNLAVILPSIALFVVPRSALISTRIDPPLLLTHLGGPPTYLLLQNFRI